MSEARELAAILAADFLPIVALVGRVVKPR